MAIVHNQVNDYAGSEIDNDSGVSGATVSDALDNLVVGGALPQQKTYVVGDSGNDSNNGKSRDTPFLTLAKAITEVNLETRGLANQWGIEVIGGMDITVDFTIPTFTTINAPEATFSCNITGALQTVINAANILGKSVGGACIRKATSGVFNVNVDILQPKDKGILHTSSGEIIVNVGVIQSTNSIIDAGCTGEVYINCTGSIRPQTSTTLFNHTSTGNIYITANEIIDNQIGGVSLTSSGTGDIYFNVNAYSCPNRILYSITGGADIHFNGALFDDSFGSTTLSGGSHLLLNINKDGVNKSIIRNDIEGVLIKSVASGKKITCEVEGGTPLICDPDQIRVEKITVGGDATIEPTLVSVDKLTSRDGDIDIGVSDFHGTTNTDFVGLSTGGVSIETFEEGCLYVIAIKTPDNDYGTFLMLTGIFIGNAFTHDAGTASNLTVVESPAGTFTLTVGGYTPAFKLVINTGDNSATFATASGTATGTTQLKMMRLRP